MASRGDGMQLFRLPDLPEGLPFSSAVRVGGLVYVSGQIGHRPGDMRLVEGGVEAETRQALAYVRAALEMAGSSLDRVIKCTVFFADIETDFARVNEVYRACFGGHLPARSGIGVRALALGARVEIECIALARD